MKTHYYNLRQNLYINQLTHAFPGMVKPFVLCYHQINADEFDNHLEVLKQKFEILDLFTFQNRILEKKKGAYCTITLDDCLEKDVDKATTICKKHDVPLTFFLPVRFSLKNQALPGTKVQRILEEKPVFLLRGKALDNSKNAGAGRNVVNEYFNPANLTIDEFDERVVEWFEENGFSEKEVIQAGDKVLAIDKVTALARDPLFSFQSHTYNHETLARCDADKIEFEFAESKQELSARTGKNIFAICYPYGSKQTIGAKALEAASKYYSCGFTLIQGVCSKMSDIFFLPRIGIYPGDGVAAFQGKIYHYMQMAFLPGGLKQRS